MALFPEYRHRHVTLGEIVGLARGDDVVQFRGIPFADIPGRFRQSVLRESLPQVPFDARQPGPICPQPPLPFPPYWDGDVPEGWPALQAPAQDEFSCLNLNITVPRSALAAADPSSAGLPVFFFIHGGAYVGGSQSVQVGGRELYDGTGLSRAAAARGQPVVVVSCNYRVGPLGFLASRELADFNARRGEAAGNYGLHDQRQALEWCARHVAGFGGDPANVTVNGTSAGGSSAHFLSLFRERRFRRAILSSGTLTGIGPMAVEYHQRNFDRYLQRAVEAAPQGGGGGGASDPVREVQALPIHEMIRPVTEDIYHPFIDGDWVPGQRIADFKDVYHGDAPELMVGSCEFEADLTEGVMIDFETGKPLPDSRMLAKIHDFVATNGLVADTGSFPAACLDVGRAYGIDDEALRRAPSRALAQWAQLLADVAFRIPTVHVGQQHAAGVLVYHMRCTNPFPRWASSFGKANHAINDLFVFDVAGDQVPAELREQYRGCVAQVRAAWLDFCYGKQPWRPMRREGGALGPLGPLFSFENGPAGREAETLEQAVGDEVAGRWRLVMKTMENMET